MADMDKGSMSRWKVVEKDEPNAVHLYTWSKERCEEWIEEYGDSKMFDDKTLTKDSFMAVEIEEQHNA